MNGLQFLDLVIGLIFIYLVYSIACSTLWEIMISFSHLRGKMLFKWLYNSFGGGEKELGKLIEKHPLIKGLTRNDKSKPSYISSGVFTDVLLDIINSQAGKTEALNFNMEVIKKRISETPLLKEEMKRVFLQYLSEAGDKIDILKQKIARWYDETQERLLGAYKKKLQWWIFVISLVLVGATNADTFKLCSYLYTNDSAREAIANKASLYVQDSSVVRMVSSIDTVRINEISGRSQEELIKGMAEDFKTLKNLDKELKQAEIPIGWTGEKLENFWDYVKKIGGLLLTALAVSMGSPFWFDVLGKLANLRSSGSKPKSVLDEKLKTRKN
jgi:hypothetical protein